MPGPAVTQAGRLRRMNASAPDPLLACGSSKPDNRRQQAAQVTA